MRHQDIANQVLTKLTAEVREEYVGMKAVATEEMKRSQAAGRFSCALYATVELNLISGSGLN